MEDNNRSFNEWFRIMWSNSYIQLFLVGLIMLICEIIYWPELMEYLSAARYDGLFETIMIALFLLIPIGIISAIGYLGFYKFWKELGEMGGKND